MSLSSRAAAATPAAFNTAFLPLIDGLQEAVWLVDARTHCVVAVNAASQQLTGLHAKDLVGASIESLASTPEDALFWMDAAIGRREPLHTDTMMRHADGRMTACGAKHAGKPCGLEDAELGETDQEALHRWTSTSARADRITRHTGIKPGWVAKLQPETSCPAGLTGQTA